MTDEFKDASPRPWTVDFRGGKLLVVSVAKIDGSAAYGPIAEMVVWTPDRADCDAHLVVRAVNAFEPMREALTKLRPFVEEDFPPDAPDAFATPAYADAYQAMVRAIRAANGEGER